MDHIITFITESLQELRQVRWPTRQQAIRFSFVVIGFVLACAVVFGLIDFGLAELVKLMLSFV